MQKPKKTSYNDGVLTIVEEKQKLNSFNAKSNVKTKEEFNEIIKLFYEEQSKRQEDVLFAKSMDRKLTLKLKTPEIKNMKTNYKVLIDDVIYDILHLDFDKNNHTLYFYLEEVRKIAR